MRPLIISISIMTTLSASALAGEPLPRGWGGGDKIKGYVLETDPHEKLDGFPVLAIRSTPETPADGHAAIGTSFLAERYRGKRVRFSAFVKSAGLERWGGLYLAVKRELQASGAEGYLRYDNMMDRQIQGTTAWTRYDVVLDVPVEAEYFSLGFHLFQKGTLWMSRPTFETVGLDVPVTRATGSIPVDLPKEPQLDLAKR